MSGRPAIDGAARRPGGRRALGRVRGAGAVGSARVGDRPLRQRARDLDGVPGGRCRADRHGLQDRSRRARLLDRHGPAAAGDARSRRAAPRALRGPPARAPLPRRGPGAAPRRPPRAEPVLQLRREPAALLQRPQGAAADAGARRPRRLGDRAPARPVGLALRHPQDRDRPRPRGDREAEPARRVGRGRGLGLPARERRARPTRSTRRATPRSAAQPCTRPVAAGQPMRAGRWWWETDAPKECGMHCAIETGGFEHELHAIVGEGSHE